jgi:universal stress protein E
MQRIRRILVAVKDAGAQSLPAVTKGAQLARRLDAALELFHAIDTPIYADIQGDPRRALEARLRDESRERLEHIAARLRRRGIAVTTAVQWDYPAYEGVIRRARYIGADLIVAQCHEGRHRVPWLLRMTDWELLRSSTVPVLLVKNAAPYRRPAVLAALDPGHAFAKPAQLDQAILDAATEVTSALGGKLHAVHAKVPVSLAVHAEGWSEDVYEELEAETAAAAKAGFAKALADSGIGASQRHLVHGIPAEAIVNVARKTRCGIVVMGAISRSALKRVFIGNTAERVLDELPCDVLVVKPRGFVSHVPRAGRGVREIVAALPLP